MTNEKDFHSDGTKALHKSIGMHSDIHLNEMFNSDKTHAVFIVIRYAWFQKTHILHCGQRKDD